MQKNRRLLLRSTTIIKKKRFFRIRFGHKSMTNPTICRRTERAKFPLRTRGGAKGGGAGGDGVAHNLNRTVNRRSLTNNTPGGLFSHGKRLYVFGGPRRAHAHLRGRGEAGARSRAAGGEGARSRGEGGPRTRGGVSRPAGSPRGGAPSAN